MISVSQKIKDYLVRLYTLNFERAGVDVGLISQMQEIINKSKLTEQDYHDLKEIFREGYRQRKNFVITESNPLNMVGIEGTEHLLDFGANNLRVINYLARKYPDMNLTAVDIIEMNGKMQAPRRTQYKQIKPDLSDFHLKDERFDLINVRFVLHHFQSEELIQDIFNRFYKLLKTGGRLILWEESFDNSDSLDELLTQNAEDGFYTDKTLTQDFYNFTDNEKLDCIYFNDWIINYANNHMPWTGQYYSWNDWRFFAENVGFMQAHKYNLGVRINGAITQGFHIVGVFEKN